MYDDVYDDMFMNCWCCLMMFGFVWWAVWWFYWCVVLYDDCLMVFYDVSYVFYDGFNIVFVLIVDDDVYLAMLSDICFSTFYG